MEKFARNTVATNRDYQRAFAQSLVQSLGYEDAVAVCLENLWEGTLRCILKEPQTSRLH